ncbi:putative nucleic acid-binding protein [Helianthus anomalus]
MEPEKLSATTICTVVSIDHTDLHYTDCSLCERTLPDSLTRCNHCPGSGSTSKRLFRVLMSVATDTNVFVVVLLTVLLGFCSVVLLMISSVSTTLILSLV